MIKKEKLLEYIRTFPDQLEIDTLIERLLLISKIEERMQMSVENDTISEEQLKDEIQKWSR